MDWKANSQRGSAYLASLIFTAIIGMSLGGYLMVVQNQNIASMRSLTWNSIVPVAEAGIEEALTHINMNGTNIIAGEGWELVDNKYLMKSRTIGGDTVQVGYTTSIPPVIIAQGFSKFPHQKSLLSRTLMVRTQMRRMFENGMVARRNVDLRGNQIFIDSFDSGDEQYSTNGRYDPSKNKDNGTLATNSDLDDSLNAGNAKILGRVKTGALAEVQIGPNGVVGDKAWHAGGNKGIQPGAHDDDLNVAFITVEAPFTSGWGEVKGGAIDGVTYDYIFETGDWEVNALTFGGRVLIRGEARILVRSDMRFTGQDFIQIEEGASLQLYMAGRTATLGGQGVHNDTGAARNFIYYGLPTNEQLTFSGNAEFIGAIYAPHTRFSIGGGGNDIYDFAGACVTDTITMNGKVNFHFDEDLARNGPVHRIVAASWDEVPYGWEEILNGKVDLLGLLEGLASL
jgi:hypothetical protein